MTETLMNVLPALGDTSVFGATVLAAVLFAIAVAEFVWDGWVSWLLAGAYLRVADLIEAVVSALGDE